MTRLEDFVRTATEFLMENDCDCMSLGYAENYKTAMENPCDCWDYLWWLNTENSRGICLEYQDVL